jgi:hypothetical protein
MYSWVLLDNHYHIFFKLGKLSDSLMAVSPYSKHKTRNDIRKDVKDNGNNRF